MVNEKLKSYYNQIAKDYDQSRFENSYGSFIDKSERQFLIKEVINAQTILDLGVVQVDF